MQQQLDEWGNPIVRPFDGHSAYGCNNRLCVQHPAHLYGQPCRCRQCVDAKADGAGGASGSTSASLVRSFAFPDVVSEEREVSAPTSLIASGPAWNSGLAFDWTRELRSGSIAGIRLA